MRGAKFQAVHELLDLVVEHARHDAHTVAERLVALGLPTEVRIKTVANKATTSTMIAGFQQTHTVIVEVISAIDAALVTVRTAVEELTELDPVSQNVAIEIARGFQKDRWFLFADMSTKQRGGIAPPA